MRRGPPAIALAAVALSLGAAATPAAADDEVPRGQLGLAIAFRMNLGALAERYGLGYFYGVVAGYQITRPDDRISIGALLTTLRGSSQFFENEYLNEALDGDDPTVAGGPLSYREISLGLRIRVGVVEALPLYAALGGGATLMRTDVPIAPDDERLHLGGYGGLGMEYYLGAFLIGADTRYGLIGEGPRSVTFMVTAGLGR